MFKIVSLTDDIREKCRLIVQSSKYVKVNYEAINRFTDDFSRELKNWTNEIFLDSNIHYVGDPIKSIWYLFVVDSVNFCFWADRELDKWTVNYKGQELSGYKALACCLKREAENSELFVYPYYWAKIFKREFMRMIYPTYDDLFYARGELKLIEERVTNLRELGENIFEKPISEMYKRIFWKDLQEKNSGFKIKEEENDPYKLSYENKNNPKRILDIIIEANRDVNKFVKLVVDTFSNYKDTADYQLNNGKVINVGFYKRAQLLAHDLYLLYQYYHKNNPEVIERESFVKYLDFKNIDNLTAFADYKLPQFLHNKGIITYSEDLLNDIKNGKLINTKDIKEVEIRAATVVAVDELASKTKTYPAFVDNVLWNLAKVDANSLIYPHHKTLTIYY